MKKILMTIAVLVFVGAFLYGCNNDNETNYYLDYIQSESGVSLHGGEFSTDAKLIVEEVSYTDPEAFEAIKKYLKYGIELVDNRFYLYDIYIDINGTKQIITDEVEIRIPFLDQSLMYDIYTIVDGEVMHIFPDDINEELVFRTRDTSRILIVPFYSMIEGLSKNITINTSINIANYDPDQDEDGLLLYSYCQINDRLVVVDCPEQIRFYPGQLIYAAKDEIVDEDEFLGFYVESSNGNKTLLTNDSEAVFVAPRSPVAFTNLIAVYGNPYTVSFQTNYEDYGQIANLMDENLELINSYILEYGLFGYAAFTAVPKEGYKFTGWYLKDDNSETLVSTDPVFIFDQKEINAHYVARFVEDVPATYTFYFDAGNGGRIIYNDEEFYSSSVTVEEGESVIIEAKADYAYKFVGWYTNDPENPVLLDTNSRYEYVAGSDTFVVLAIFEPKENIRYEISTTSVAEFNEIVGELSFKIGSRDDLLTEYTNVEIEGNEVVLEAVPSSITEFVGWYKATKTDETIELGELISPELNCSIILVEDIFIVGAYKTKPHTSINAFIDIYGFDEVPGKLFVNGVEQEDYSYAGPYPVGSEVIFTVEAKFGYEFVGWYIFGEDTLYSTNETITVVIGESELKLTAKIKETDKYLFEAHSIINNLIDGQSPSYYFKSVNGERYGDDYYSEELPAGSKLVFEPFAEVGCKFVGWYEIELSAAGEISAGELISEDPSYEFTTTTEAKQVAAVYEAVPSYFVSIYTQYPGITIKLDGVNLDNNNLSEYYEEGTVLNLSVEIAEGFKFVGWTMPNQPSLEIYSEETSIQVTVGTEEICLSPMSEALPYYEFQAYSDLETNLGDTEYYPTYYFELANGELYGDDFYSSSHLTGEQIKLKACAKDLCTFKGWYQLSISNDGLFTVGELISTELEYTFTIGSEDMNVIAIYEAVQASKLTIIIKDAGIEGVTVNGVECDEGESELYFAVGTTINISATLYQDFTFDAWYDLSGTAEVVKTNEISFTFVLNEDGVTLSPRTINA